jgi:hypothetical protein
MPSRRIFDLGAGSFVGVTPSGFVPGGGVGAGAARSPVTGGVDEGLDCSCKFLVWVMYAKSEDYVVFSVFLWVLRVTCSPL